MDDGAAMKQWRLTIATGLFEKLHGHLFPGDNDEHGAVILAGVIESDRGVRLVAREVHLAVDGLDYVPGKRGYRMLKAEFIQRKILRARDKKLAYLAIHNHGGSNFVAFSGPDIASHERGYPALLDIARGMPVGALVLAHAAVAGELWLPCGKRAILSETIIVGHQRRLLFPRPSDQASAIGMYDRQSRLFGDSGQALLSRIRVGIIGLGGAGSVLAELLGRLGVGEFVLADPDRAEETNLPRLIAARRSDAVISRWLPQSLLKTLRRRKVFMAARNIHRANRQARIQTLARDFLDDDVAARFTDCDFLFLAADTMSARLLFNAIVHQYGIPGIQVGAKIPVSDDGVVGEVFCVSRMITPEQGCLWCNGLINPGRLQDEAIPLADQRNYAYVDDPNVIAPSVVTLNALACSHAADEFLFHLTGLRNADAQSAWFRWNSRRRMAWYDMPRSNVDCGECSHGEHSRFAMGDNAVLPTSKNAS